jgi:uncharacterized protein YutE (UPF0331/DUF86 family)
VRLDLYQAETARIAQEQAAALAMAKAILATGRSLTSLEQNGVLHALQILIENAIGKGKHLLKSRGLSVPISGYDTFKALSDCDLVPSAELNTWKSLVGMRNRIVHDYMNIDMDQVILMLKGNKEQFVVDFLRQDIARIK